MTYRGHIRNGVAVLDTPVTLPDGTAVRVEVEREGSSFWQNKALAQLAREQSRRPTENADELSGAWPDDDPIDEFLSFLREVRR